YRYRKQRRLWQHRIDLQDARQLLRLREALQPADLHISADRTLDRRGLDHNPIERQCQRLADARGGVRGELVECRTIEIKGHDRLTRNGIRARMDRRAVNLIPCEINKEGV